MKGTRGEEYDEWNQGRVRMRDGSEREMTGRKVSLSTRERWRKKGEKEGERRESPSRDNKAFPMTSDPWTSHDPSLWTGSGAGNRTEKTEGWRWRDGRKRGRSRDDGKIRQRAAN